MTTHKPLTLAVIDTRFQQNNIRAPARLTQQCRYISRAGDVPLFGRLLAPVSPTEARYLIACHGLTPAWTGPVAYHRVILSLRADQGLDDTATARALVCVALDELSLLLDRRPVWVAGLHRDTDHTHAHVLLAGSDDARQGDKLGRSVEIRGRTLERWKGLVEERARRLVG